MIVYHGSNVIVQKPQILQSYRMLDFGPGFYTTNDYKQAIRWVKTKCERNNSPSGFVNTYEIEDNLLADNTMKVHFFRGASKQWLRFVISNRMRPGFMHDYDIIMGPVANDRVYACLNAFENRFLTYEMAVQELKTYKLINQVSFHTSKAMSLLRFIEGKEVRT